MDSALIILGSIVIGALAITAIVLTPADSNIPPTPAFSHIQLGNNTVTMLNATDYMNTISLATDRNSAATWQLAQANGTIYITLLTEPPTAVKRGSVFQMTCASGQFFKGLDSAGHFICESVPKP